MTQTTAQTWKLYWTDDEDPENPGWCVREEDGTGHPLEATDRDDVAAAVAEATRDYAYQGDLLEVTMDSDFDCQQRTINPHDEEAVANLLQTHRRMI